MMNSAPIKYKSPMITSLPLPLLQGRAVRVWCKTASTADEKALCSPILRILFQQEDLLGQETRKVIQGVLAKGDESPPPIIQAKVSPILILRRTSERGSSCGEKNVEDK